jgi:ribosomal protein S18 acetylase RimI-like enzyme
LALPHATVLVAEVKPDRDVANKVLCGAVSLQVYDTPADPFMVQRRRVHVDALIVDQAHRRRGFGRRLMDAANNWARLQGADELVLTAWIGNAGARDFYQRLGYRVLSEVMQKEIV